MGNKFNTYGISLIKGDGTRSEIKAGITLDEAWQLASGNPDIEVWGVDEILGSYPVGHGSNHGVGYGCYSGVMDPGGAWFGRNGDPLR